MVRGDIRPVHLGVIGCGVIGCTHIAAATRSPLVQVVAVADLNEQARQSAAEKFGITTVYDDGMALLDDEQVEAVVLALPTFTRKHFVLCAFSKGKHVLIEKPIAMNAEEVVEFIDARGDLTAGCCSSRFRLMPSAKAATEFIASGELGQIRLIRARHIVPVGARPEEIPPAWRLNKSLNGGGILVNWGCYDLDYLLGLTGQSLKPSSVLAQSWPIPSQFESFVAAGSDAETYFDAFIRCDDGAVISLERGEYMPAHEDSAWQIIGTKGSLRLKMTIDKDTPKTIYYDTAQEQGVTSRAIWEGKEDAGTLPTKLIEDFALAVQEHRQPMTSLEQALIIQKISDAIYESSERGLVAQVN